MSELKPCPLCGEKVLWVTGAIRCQCGLRYDPPVWGSKKLVESRWNTRAERTCELTFRRGAIYDVAHYSCCGYEFPEPISEVAPSENYCPNCGAKVVSE